MDSRAEGLTGLEVDDKLDFAGLFNWTTRRARTRTSFRLIP
jgi:hypothetical protein